MYVSTENASTPGFAGISGEKTSAAINNGPEPSELFERFKKAWLNRLNGLKFVWIVMMVFLMTCLPGCKSVTSVENTVIETAETLTEPVTVRSPTSPKGDFASPNSSILRSVNSFQMKKVSKTIETRCKALKSSRPHLFRYLSLWESGVIRRLTRDSPQSSIPDPKRMILNPAGIAGFFLSAEQKQPDCSDKTARLFRQNSPTVQTKQPDCLDNTARLFRQYSPTVQTIQPDCSDIIARLFKQYSPTV